MPSLQSTGSDVRIYTVQGVAGASTPDWLGSTQTRAHRERAVKRKRRGGKESTEGRSLIQDFEFPEASNKIRSTSDGRFVIATGTYKPRMKVFELDELGMKFDRVTDSENVDFCVLSTDWTKTLHLQADRTLDFHTQTHSYFRLRIPTPGRALAYHFPSCDALVGGAGSSVFRLNLSQGRFLAPFDLDPSVLGVNALDINPAHGLVAMGTESTDGRGGVELWDPRARARAATLELPYAQLAGVASASAAVALPGLEDASGPEGGASVTALSSRNDGLNLAVGTSTGHVLLYDLRASSHYTIKDQGYSLPIKALSWPSGPQATAGSGLVCSADAAVVKVWNRDDGKNLFALNPPARVNDVHVYPGSGLVMLANEASPMSSYFIPALGPAPRWARFLENMTEEMDDEASAGAVGGGSTVYDDFKFVDSAELKALSLDHLIGTPALRPYMHGHFVDLRLYAKAKAVANPFAWREHREKLVREKLEKEREGRIRSAGQRQKQREAAALARVGVNKGLAKRILEREAKEGRKRAAQAREERSAEVAGEGREEEGEAQAEGNTASLLVDPRFSKLFSDAEFEVDEYSKEFAMLNPSAADARRRGEASPDASDADSDAGAEGGGVEGAGTSEGDSSDEGDLGQSEVRQARLAKAARLSSSDRATATAAAAAPSASSSSSRPRAKPRLTVDGEAVGAPARSHTLGRRLRGDAVGHAGSPSWFRAQPLGADGSLRSLGGGAMEMSFTPSSAAAATAKSDRIAARKEAKEKKAQFGMGMSRGGEAREDEAFAGEERGGRTRRRKVERSASKNQMRRLKR